MKEKQPLFTLASTLAILLCGLLLYISQVCFWSDSEMWAVTNNYHMFSGLGFEHNHWVKPLFDLHLFVISKLGSLFGFNIMSSARVIFSVQAIISVYLFYKLSVKVSKNKLLSVFLVLVLVSTSLFWERSFRVRSDLLVLMVYLFIFNLIYSEVWTNRKKAICLGLVLVAVLITPKSIILALCLILVYSKELFFGKKIKTKYYIYIGTIVIFVVSIVAIINPTALSYFLQSFSSTGKGFSYFSIHRFEHMIRFGSKNIWLLILFLLPLVSYLKMKRLSLDKKYLLFSLSIFIVLVFYPNRLPFFIYSLIPFLLLGLVANPLTSSFFVSVKENKLYRAVVFFFIVGLSYIGLVKANFIYSKHNNFTQKEFQSKLCGYLAKYPGVKLLDPIGLCPKRLNSYYFYLGPFHDNYRHLDNIKILRPDIIVNIAKMQFLYPRLNNLLKANYFYSKAGVFYKLFLVHNPGGEMTHSQLSHRIKAKVGEPNSDFKIIHKNYIGSTDKILNTSLKGIKSANLKTLTEKSILTGYELLVVSPYNIEKLKLPRNANSLFRHDVEL